jgi:hypothetical protein
VQGLNSLAPHQASEVRHAQLERASEEIILAKSWNNVQGLSDEPPSDDDGAFADAEHSEDGLHLNHSGDQLTAGSEADMANGDEEDDMDDDMMDKISSSPSISDGGYIPQIWPRRTSSLTPANSPLVTPTRNCVSPLSLRCESGVLSGTSSPFLSTPTHPPVRCESRGYSNKPDFEALSADSGAASFCEPGESNESSAFTSSPTHFPLSLDQISSYSEHHHQEGEYEASDDPNGSTEYEYEAAPDIELAPERPLDDDDDFAEEELDQVGPLLSEQIEEYLKNAPWRPPTPTPKLEKSPSDVELDCQLLPIHDPLLDPVDPFLDSTDSLLDSVSMEFDSPDRAQKFRRTKNNVIQCVGPDSYSDDEDDWTTESESGDSFDSFEFNDDDAENFRLSIDPLFFCSGWGGECLQETEDIDFEFVYALHNFVATVEGQANAAKGDTMVLLDDSNSYWWLVRVVKDSTIGLLAFSKLKPSMLISRF